MKKIYTKDEFVAEVQAMSNRELIERGGSAVLGAAIMASRPRFNTFKDDAICDAIYDECVRRGNTDLYQRAFNDAARSQGHHSMVRPVTIPIEVGEELRAIAAPAEPDSVGVSA